MNSITHAAYLLLCAKCGRHGRVVCSDGMESHEFITVHGGLKELTDLVLSGRVSQDEVSEAEFQIRKSGLEYQNDEVEAVLEKCGERRSGISKVFDEFHQELDGAARKAWIERGREKRMLQ